MDINIKDTRLIVQLIEISYGECFEVDSSVPNYADKFVDRYFMKIKGTVPNKPDDIMFVDISNGETYSLPRSVLVCPTRAEVEVRGILRR